MSEPTYSTGASARRLGISQHHLRRLCETGLVDADQTAGGHWRIFAREIERLLQEGIPPLPAPPTERPNPARPSPVIPRAPETPAAPGPVESDDVREARDSVAIVEHKLQRRRLELEAEQVEDQFRERDRTRQAQEEEQRRHQAQASAAEARRQWEEGIIEATFARLPGDCPAEIRLSVQMKVREALHDLSPNSAARVINETVRAAAETAMQPYYLARRIAEAIEAAVYSLPRAALYHDSPWIIEARSAAKRAATRPEVIEDSSLMRTAAVQAVAAIARKFERKQTMDRLLSALRFWQLATATEADRKAVMKSAADALGALPADAGEEDMDEAVREALEPHEKALRRRLQEAEHELKIRQVVQKGMGHVSHYLHTGGWEFDSYSEQAETEKDFKAQLHPHLEALAEAREITAADVIDYVETWIDDQLEEMSDTDDEEE